MNRGFNHSQFLPKNLRPQATSGESANFRIKLNIRFTVHTNSDENGIVCKTLNLWNFFSEYWI